jgi:hypothetical protein
MAPGVLIGLVLSQPNYNNTQQLKRKSIYLDQYLLPAGNCSQNRTV